MNRRGFTLLELLVVMTVLSVVTTIGVTAFIRVTGYWNDASSLARLENGAAAAFDSMGDDFAAVLSSRTAPGAFTGVRGGVNGGGAAELADDRVTLPVEQVNAATGGRERVLVTYVIDREGAGAARLLRRSVPSTGVAGGTDTEVAKGVAGMRVSYFDGAAWRPEWRENTPPRAVRVSLLMANPAGTGRQSARKAVFNINVR